MTVLLYAIADRPVACEPGLRSVHAGGLHAVIGDRPAPPPPTVDELRAHEQIVERLMSSATVLPARFATTAADDGAIRRLLVDRHAAFSQALERVRGAVEVAIRSPGAGVDDGRRSPGAGPGTAYLLGRLAGEQAARRLEQRLDEALGGLARAAVRRAHREPSVAFLVDRSVLPEFLRRVGEIDEPGLTCTGPWPPYSFVGGTG